MTTLPAEDKTTLADNGLREAVAFIRQRAGEVQPEKDDCCLQTAAAYLHGCANDLAALQSSDTALDGGLRELLREARGYIKSFGIIKGRPDTATTEGEALVARIDAALSGDQTVVSGGMDRG